MSLGTRSKAEDGKLVSSGKNYEDKTTKSVEKDVVKSALRTTFYSPSRTAPELEANDNWLSALTGVLVADDEVDDSKYGPVRTGFSDTYIQYKTRELIKSVKQELVKWSDVENHEALPYVSAIKDVIDDKFRYLSQVDAYRLFVSGLRVIVSQWQDLTSDNIEAFIEHLDNHIDGQITDHSITVLNEFLFSQNINPFSLHE